jgi:transposase
LIHGNKHVQSALVEAAWGATRKKESYLKAFYQKLLIKKGSKKALIAISHKIIKAAYHILQNKVEYKEPLLQIEKAKNTNKQKNIQKFVTQLTSLGFSVRLTPIA